MIEILILAAIAIAAVTIASSKPHALFVFLVVVGPYYGFSKQLLDPDSLLVIWKDVVLAGLLIGLFLRMRGRLKNPTELTLLLIFCVVSAAVSGDWEAGVLGFRATCQWMLLAVASCSLRDSSLAPKLGRALIWSGTAASIVYLIERTFYQNQDLIAESMGIRSEDRWRYSLVLERFSLIYGNPNSFAVFLVICACFAFAWYLGERAGRMRFLAMLSSGLCVAGVLYTASRGAMAALLVAIVVEGRSGGTKVFRRVILAIALAGSVFVIQPDLLTQRLQETTSDKFLSSYRYQVWTSTMERAVSSPQLLIVGSGLGTYGGYVSDVKGTSDVITENQFFKILGEQGTVGLLLMFVLLWRLRKPGAEAGTESQVAVPAALAAVVTYCLFGNILDGLVVAVPFWTLVGLRLSQPILPQVQWSEHARGVSGSQPLWEVARPVRI